MCRYSASLHSVETLYFAKQFCNIAFICAIYCYGKTATVQVGVVLQLQLRGEDDITTENTRALNIQIILQSDEVNLQVMVCGG